MKRVAIQTPTTPYVALHSIVMSADSEALIENHRLFARKKLVRHEIHQPAHPDQTDWFKVLAKYNLIWSILIEGRDSDIFAFADDSLAFILPVNLTDLLGQANYWVCQDASRLDRGSGSLLILRRSAEAFAWVSAVIDQLKEFARESSGFSRWSSIELVGRYNAAYDATVDGVLANVLFPSQGDVFPGKVAAIATFNPQVLPASQDARINRLVVEHLSHCLDDGTTPFSSPNPVDLPDYKPLSGRLSRVAIILFANLNDPEIYGHTLENVHRYCKKNGYALFIKDKESVRGDGVYDMLIHICEYYKSYKYVFCMREDSLFNRLDFKVPELFKDVSLAIGQSSISAPAEVGCLGLRVGEIGDELIKAVQAAQEIYLPDEFVPLRDLLDNPSIAAGAHILDMNSFAPTCGVRNDRTFVVRYVDLPPNVRRLVMATDCLIEERIVVRGSTEPLKTSLSFFRGRAMNIVITSLLFILMIIAAVKSL